MLARIGLGLAAALTAATIATTTTEPAQARTSFSVSIGTGGPFFGYPSYGYAPYSYGYAAPSYGYYAYSQPTYQTYAVAPGYNAHVAWCQSHYRSYNAASDTFLGYDGQYHYCQAPY
jgi:hypothetical protein